MPNPGTIEGTHHLTFCVGGAQEDYDFHVRTLGLKSVKKTVLFDGEIPIYHLYYANRVGDASTILTSFPYRQAGWMGKRGTNQAKSINVAVPAASIGYWADRLKGAGSRRPRSSASAPSAWSSRTRAASRTRSWGRPATTSASPTGAATSRPSTRSAAPGAPRPRSASPTRWTTSCARPSTPSTSRSEGAHHQYRLTGSGHGQILELVEEPDLPQGTWHFGEGTIHHHAFDVGTSENQLRVKDYIVGLGYTDVSDVKDRGYFFSVYLRTPGGALFELAYSTRQGFTIDEPVDELGTHMCIPPHWEDRRPEIEQLEPIDTIERSRASFRTACGCSVARW